MDQNAASNMDKLIEGQGHAADLLLNSLRFCHGQLTGMIDLALQTAYILSVLLLVPDHRLTSSAEQAGLPCLTLHVLELTGLPYSVNIMTEICQLFW